MTNTRLTRGTVITAAAAAITLAIGGIAYAAPLDRFTADELDTNWGPDRRLPSGGVESVTAFDRPDVAQFTIEADEVHSNEHSRTEGLGQVGDFGDNVEVDLYLDPDWAGKAVRAGLWVVGDDGEGARDQNFGIIEFTNIEACDPAQCPSAEGKEYNFDTDHVGFRIWDSEETWTEYLETPFELGTWVTLSITLDTDAQEYVYAIDGVEVGTAVAGEHFIREVMLNGYNFGADTLPSLDSADYQIHFHNELPEPEFSDVPEAHPFFWEIQWLTEQEITTGFPDGDFRPSASVTRQAMAAFLYRAAGEPEFEAPDTATFSDVSTSHTFFKEIEWLVEAEITNGFADGTFRGNSSITRQAMAAFLYRAAGEPEFEAPNAGSFPDVATDHAFYDEIEWLNDTGITGGFNDGTFRPGGLVTRQAMAAFLYRADAQA